MIIIPNSGGPTAELEPLFPSNYDKVGKFRTIGLAVDSNVVTQLRPRVTRDFFYL